MVKWNRWSVQDKLSNSHSWMSPVNTLPYPFKYNDVMFIWNSDYRFQGSFPHLKAKEWIQLLKAFMDQGKSH